MVVDVGCARVKRWEEYHVNLAIGIQFLDLLRMQTNATWNEKVLFLFQKFWPARNKKQSLQRVQFCIADFTSIQLTKLTW